MEQRLYFPAKEDAALFVWVKKEGASFSLTPERETALPKLSLRDDEGRVFRRIPFSENITLPTGVYSVTLTPDREQEPLYFTLSASGGAYPFLLNGPGVWHANFLENSLHFPTGKAELYVAVPPSELDFTVSTTGIRRPNLARIYRPDGSEYAANWIPERAPWYEVDIPHTEQTGYWHIVAESENKSFRITAWNGYAMFFEQPDEMLPYAYFTPICDQKIDYRVTLWRGNHRDVVIDRLYSERFAVPYLKGDLRLEFHAGDRYSTFFLPMPKGDATSVKVSFDELLTPPAGWYFGDCHFHSGYEDACCTPAVITKAARCCGADFIFLSDHGGKMALDGGLLTHYEEGWFHPYPAQECMNKRCHMNFLNIPFDIDDKNRDENAWLRDAERKNPEGNRYVPMLNHPDDREFPGSETTYARSWFVAVENPDIPLVENIAQYRMLFNHANRGRPLTLLRTTDTHDGTDYRPASRGSYVYIGDKCDGNATVDALRAGRVVATMSPGVFMTFTVNGEMPGAHLDINACDRFDIDIQLMMTDHQLKEVALVRNERVIETFFPEDVPVQHFRCTVTREQLLSHYYTACWLSVAGYSEKTPENRPNAHNAYTKNIYTYVNPVYFDGVEPIY